MATATKPTPTIRIGGTHYAVEIVPAPAGFRWAWRLTRIDPRRGLVSHVVCRSATRWMTCSCEATTYRKPDSTEVDCKHVRAIRSALADGLL